MPPAGMCFETSERAQLTPKRVRVASRQGGPGRNVMFPPDLLNDFRICLKDPREETDGNPEGLVRIPGALPHSILEGT